MKAARRGLIDSGDQWIAVLAVAALGCGTPLVLHGALSGQIVLAAAGAALAGAGLVVLVLGGWIDGLVLVALSLPLPALFGDAGVRITSAALVTAVVVLAWALGLGSSRHVVELAVSR